MSHFGYYFAKQVDDSDTIWSTRNANKICKLWQVFLEGTSENWGLGVLGHHPTYMKGSRGFTTLLSFSFDIPLILSLLWSFNFGGLFLVGGKVCIVCRTKLQWTNVIIFHFQVICLHFPATEKEENSWGYMPQFLFWVKINSYM